MLYNNRVSQESYRNIRNVDRRRRMYNVYSTTKLDRNESFCKRSSNVKLHIWVMCGDTVDTSPSNWKLKGKLTVDENYSFRTYEGKVGWRVPTNHIASPEIGTNMLRCLPTNDVTSWGDILRRRTLSSSMWYLLYYLNHHHFIHSSPAAADRHSSWLEGVLHYICRVAVSSQELVLPIRYRFFDRYG